MVLAYHVIFTARGFWLPNDPRGSWSDFVGAWELFRFGPATKTDTRQSVAGRSHNRKARLEAKAALKYPAVSFDGLQARSVAEGFKKSITKGKVTVWACAILPEHVHLVIARHRCKVETLVSFLKGEATKKLLADGLHPLADYRTPDGSVPSCWAHKHWQVYLDEMADIERAIPYVENNPEKEGRRKQRWTFVAPFHRDV